MAHLNTTVRQMIKMSQQKYEQNISAKKKQFYGLVLQHNIDYWSRQSTSDCPIGSAAHVEIVLQPGTIKWSELGQGPW